jgi:hypothetical protein
VRHTFACSRRHHVCLCLAFDMTQNTEGSLSREQELSCLEKHVSLLTLLMSLIVSLSISFPLFKKTHSKSALKGMWRFGADQSHSQAAALDRVGQPSFLDALSPPITSLLASATASTSATPGLRVSVQCAGLGLQYILAAVG